MRPTPQERFKPGADPDEVREYERLLAERFATDPSGPKTAGQLLTSASARRGSRSWPSASCADRQRPMRQSARSRSRRSLATSDARMTTATSRSPELFLDPLTPA